MSKLDERFPLLVEGRQATLTGQTIVNMLKAQRRKTLEQVADLAPHNQYLSSTGTDWECWTECFTCYLRGVLAQTEQEGQC